MARAQMATELYFIALYVCMIILYIYTMCIYIYIYIVLYVYLWTYRMCIYICMIVYMYIYSHKVGSIVCIYDGIPTQVFSSGPPRMPARNMLKHSKHSRPSGRAHGSVAWQRPHHLQFIATMATCGKPTHPNTSQPQRTRPCPPPIPHYT